jgi:hypothetical protein
MFRRLPERNTLLEGLLPDVASAASTHDAADIFGFKHGTQLATACCKTGRAKPTRLCCQVDRRASDDALQALFCAPAVQPLQCVVELLLRAADPKGIPNLSLAPP